MSHTQMAGTYPCTEVFSGNNVIFQLMTRADRDALVAFARALHPEDSMFLRLDITDPKVIDQWIGHIEEGDSVTVLAYEGGNVIGYGTLHTNETWWTRHLGQVRVLVQNDRRKLGLGRHLAMQVFQLARARNIRRIFVQMAADQPYVRHIFEDIGFLAEALLTGWVMDRSGKSHDLLIMSYHVGGAGD